MRSVGRLADKVARHVILEVCERRYQRHWVSKGRRVPSDVSIQEIVAFLGNVGIAEGSALLVHSAWANITRERFTAVDLITALQAMVGSGGTLAMPAYPPYALQRDGGLFDVRKTPSGGGWLTECFRRMPGVLRSIHLNHSVCAWGVHAAYLTQDHHLGDTSWDEYSPYYRIGQLPDAWIIGLGVGHRLRVATSLHCVESLLRIEVPYFNRIFQDPITYTFRLENGDVGTHRYRKRIGEIYPPKIAAHFSSAELVEATIGGLEVYAIRARTLIQRSVELGRLGKTMYVWPVPWPWKFSK